MNQLIAGHKVKNGEPGRCGVVEVGGNFGASWTEVTHHHQSVHPDQAPWPAKDPCLSFSRNPQTPWRVPGYVSYRHTEAKTEQFRSWFPGFFSIAHSLVTTYFKKSFAFIAGTEIPQLCFHEQRGPPCRFDDSIQLATSILPSSSLSWAMIHHCLGLCHWCQLAHSPSPLPSQPHLGMHGGRP